VSLGGDERLSLGLLALLTVVCCALPILLAMSIGLTAAATGGAVVGAIAAGALSTVFLIRRRARAAHRHVSNANKKERTDSEPSGP
jgi:phosphotransferase system  glucose/maltose/N-acetylglucosamine-specific IIC component